MSDAPYPPDWPRCVCGDFALDGKATCGRVECKLGSRSCPVCDQSSDREGFYAPAPDDKTLVIYPIYEKPKDFPEEYVARRWEVRDGVQTPTRFYARARTLSAVRDAIPAGKVRIVEANVDPCIVETWI